MLGNQEIVKEKQEPQSNFGLVGSEINQPDTTQINQSLIHSIDQSSIQRALLHYPQKANLVTSRGIHEKEFQQFSIYNFPNGAQRNIKTRMKSLRLRHGKGSFPGSGY